MQGPACVSQTELLAGPRAPWPARRMSLGLSWWQRLTFETNDGDYSVDMPTARTSKARAGPYYLV